MSNGAPSFNGTSSYLQIPSDDFSTYPISGSTTTAFSASFGVWFKISSARVILGQTDGGEPPSDPGGYVPALYVDTEGNLRASLFYHGGADQIITASAYNDNNWHLAVDTFANETETLYVDGLIANSQQVEEIGYKSSYTCFLGTGHTTSDWPAANGAWFYFDGALDEINVSNVARSSDWV